MPNQDPLAELLGFVERLEQARIHYSLSRSSTGQVAVEIAVPGERFTASFSADGRIQIQKYVSTGKIERAAALHALMGEIRKAEPAAGGDS